MRVYRPGTITREESVGNIISSITAEESAIAHILNAESEKLQAVEELMAINHSVKTAVDTVIRLEMALKAKLEMFQSTICQIG